MANLDYHGLSLYDSLLDIDKAKAAALAPQFDSSEDYYAGDYVMYQGVLYQFTASHSAGAWTGSDAAAVQLATAVKGLQDLNALVLGLYPQREITDVAIANFSDGADEIPIKKLIAEIAPVQDLHGQSNPYPPGGGKNKYNATRASTTMEHVTITRRTDGSYVFNGTATAQFDYYFIGGPASGWTSIPAGQYIASGLPQSSSSYALFCCVNVDGTTSYTQVGADGTQVNYSSDGKCDFLLRVFSGTTLNNFVVSPMLRLSSVSDATFAPYSNICPITGWTGANVYDTGTNIWDEETETGTIDATNGALVTDSGRARSKNYVPVNGGTTYYFYSGTATNDAFTIVYYKKDKSYLSGVFKNINNAVTVPDGAYYMKFSLPIVYGATYNNDISINYPSTDHSYHASKGVLTEQITFPDAAGTVYGATITVNGDGTGKLVVYMVAVDMGTLSWGTQAASGGAIRFGASLPGAKPAASASSYSNTICSTYKNITADDSYNKTAIGVVVYTSSGVPTVFVYDPAYSDKDVFKAAMDGQTLVYELATPVEYTLTAGQVGAVLKTTLGENNVWVTTGDIQLLIYRASLQSQLDAISTQLMETVPSMIAGVEADFTATRNYTAGDYFVVDQVLYKATANIANGATITPNVNCAETTVGEELVNIVNS